ncbi:copper resistance CopC/CopD family protein [Nocardia sp. NPDC020380]|uniref:copper resistance CopC/CopD family protein n=1 Tax=Nocardia sp. NPDC020380 TaxID=3364309 RepID=UPI0037A6F396
MNRVVRGTARALAALAVMLGVVTFFAPSASAHAVLVASSPADGARVDQAPRQVTLTFDEAVGLIPGAERVIGLDGTRADTGEVRLADGGRTIVIALRAAPADGTYSASWRVVSADTHIVSGSIRFGIGAAPSDVAVAGPPVRTRSLDDTAAVAQGVLYAGIVLGFGIAAVARCLWPWTRRRRPVRVLIRLGWGLCLAGTLAQLLLMGPRADNVGWSGVAHFDGFGDSVDSHIGRVLLARTALLAVSSAVAWTRRNCSIGVLACGAAILVTVALTGHEAVGSNVWVATTSAVVHLGSMAVWLGGLTVLGLVILPRIRLSRRVPIGYLAPWSQTAFCCVGLLILTGEYQARRQIQPVPSLWSTHYGVVLLIKLALVALMLGSAWWAQRQIAGRGDRSREQRFAAVTRSVGVETIVAVGVLAVTALLVSEPPALTTYGPPVTATAPVGPGSSARIHVDTTRRGREAITLQILDATAKPFSVPSLQAVLSSDDAGIAALTVTLQRDPTDPTRWNSTGAVVPLPGEWKLAVTVNLPGDVAYVTSVDYPVW